jgi:putative phosphonate metabolism protein
MITETRYAVYGVPPLGSVLKRLGDAWLGRDPDADERVSQPIVEGLHPERLQEITMAPRHYGFHATLKAPFVLADGREAIGLSEAVAAFAASRRPFEVPLTVAGVDGFIALVPAERSEPVESLAADCVRELDGFRAPLTDEDRERRNPERLTERQRGNLERGGYPYVLEDFGFHMTLTSRLEEPEHGRVKALLERLMAPAIARPLPVAEVALFVQTHRVAPFRVVERFPLGG